MQKLLIDNRERLNGDIGEIIIFEQIQLACFRVVAEKCTCNLTNMYGLDPILPGDIEDCSIEPFIQATNERLQCRQFCVSTENLFRYDPKLCKFLRRENLAISKITEINVLPNQRLGST